MKSTIDHLKILLIPAVLLTIALAAASCGSGGGYGGGGSPTGPGGSGGAPKELNSGDIRPGGTFTHRFTTAGNFHYHCIHHPMMTGNVLVTDAALDTLVNVSIVSDMSPFHAATVKPGGRVHWTNNNGLVHTVTSN